MKTAGAYASSIRQRQTEETRRSIVEAALQMIGEQPDEALSHEKIASRIGAGLRTVYHHFPSRADLLDAVWQESMRRLQLTQFPQTEADLLAAVEPVFGSMDEHADLMRGLLHSNAGQAMRRRDNEPRRAGVEKALQDATSHLPADERRRVVAVFQALFSARTWETMRDRAHLPEGEAAKAVEWAMRSLLSVLRSEAKAASASSAAPQKPRRAGKGRC